MTDANRVAYVYKQESTYGGSQTGSNYELRCTSDTLRQETDTTNSAELRSDRQIAAFVRTAKRASGDTNHELSLTSFDRIWQGLLMDTNDFDHSLNTGTNFGATVDWTDRVEDTSPAEIFDSGAPFGAVSDGDWVKIEDSSTSSNDGIYRVIEATTTRLYLSGTGITADSSDVITVRVLDRISDQAPSSTDDLSFAFQKQYTDYTGSDGNDIAAYFGMMLEGMSLTAAREQIITFALNWFGQQESSASVELTAGVTSSTDPLNTIDNIDKIVIGDIDQTAVELSFQVNNNLRAQLELGQLNIPDMGFGTINASGKVQVYYEGDVASSQYDLAEMNRYLNGNFSSLGIVFTDGSDYLVFDFPRIKYSAGQRVAQGINQDTILDLDWTAYKMGDTDITGGRTSIDNDHTLTIHRYVAP